MSLRRRIDPTRLACGWVMLFGLASVAHGFHLKRSIAGFETPTSQNLNYELTSDKNIKQLVAVLFGGVTADATEQAKLDHVKYFFTVPLTKDNLGGCLRYYLQSCPLFTANLINQPKLAEINVAQISYVIKLKQEVIGEVTLDDYKNDVLHIGGVAVSIFIAKEHTGKGYGTEAVAKILEIAKNVVASDRVYLQCRVLNIPSRKLAARLGFAFVEEFTSLQGEDKLLFVLPLKSAESKLIAE